MKTMLALAAAFGLSLSAAQACDFHKTAHADENMTVAGTTPDTMSRPDTELKTASVARPAENPPVGEAAE